MEKHRLVHIGMKHVENNKIFNTKNCKAILFEVHAISLRNIVLYFSFRIITKVRLHMWKIGIISGLDSTRVCPRATKSKFNRSSILVQVGGMVGDLNRPKLQPTF